MEAELTAGEHFRYAFQFLSKYKWVFRSSNTQFLIDGVLDECPREWMQFLSTLSNEDLNSLPLGLEQSEMPTSLREFFNELKRLRPSHPTSPTSVLTINKFNGISPKKLHEIHRLALEIDTLLKSADQDVILVDLGSGLGYLSQLLAERYGYRVLGLEADEERVTAARKRQQQHFSSTLSTVVFAAHFVNSSNGPDSSMEFIRHALVEHFGATLGSTRIALIGLHACADLTVTACQMFGAMDAACALAIMPCCYHKMRFGQDGTQFENIPLSKSMRDAGDWSIVINRPFLRLACQQTAARWERMSALEHRQHGCSMFDRAALEVLLRSGESVKKVKKKASKGIPSEQTCTQNALEVYELFGPQSPQPWTQGHYQQFEAVSKTYPNGAEFAEILTGLQASIQAICEYVVLLDKVCYLHENGERNNISVGLKKIFEEALSPRCFLLTATK